MITYRAITTEAISRRGICSGFPQFLSNLPGTSTNRGALSGSLSLILSDADGNLVTLTDANGHATSNGYDLLYELTTKTLPDGTNQESRTYDFAGNLHTLTNFNGYTTTYAYDTLNRLSSRTPDSRTGEPVVSFTYTNTASGPA